MPELENPQSSVPMSDSSIYDFDSPATFDESSGKIVLSDSFWGDQKPVEQKTLDIAGQQQQQTRPDDDRVAKLEATVTQQNQILQQIVPAMLGYMQGQQGNQIPATPEYDLSDANQLRQYTENTIEAKINKALQPILQILPQLASQVSQNSAAVKYGNQYNEMLPHVQSLMSVSPGMSADQAFQIVSQIRGTQQQPVQRTAVQKPQGTPQELLDKAQTLRTEKGMSHALKGEMEIKNLRDALMDAKRELMGL